MSSSGSPLQVVVLASSAIELSVLPQRGARLHHLRAFGHDVLRTPEDLTQHERDPFFWGAFVMAPWCNRLAARRTQLDNSTVDLLANFRDGTAIHGQVYACAWQQVSESRFEVSAGGDGWPWPYQVTLELSVRGATLSIEQVLRNMSAERMPAGIGLHPWFRPVPAVAVRAERVYTSNTDSAARPEPVAGRHDLRRLGRMEPGLDGTWADLTSPQVDLHWPALRLSASLSATASAGDVHITAASPSDVDAVALEPQTHAPQGLRRLLNGEPGALQLIEPGARLVLTTRLEFRQKSREIRA